VSAVKLPKIRVRPAALRLAPYRAPEEGRLGKLRLDFNENTLGCSKNVIRALARITPEELAIYPEYQASIEKLARFFRVRPDEMHLSNGIDDALHLIADTFIDADDEVLLAEPTFDMYRFFAELAGASVTAVRYDEEMRYPVKEILRALRTKPRVLYIANPNNPTGTLVKAEELRRILRAGSKTLVLVDEAYFDFSGLTVISWIRRYSNLVVARTFSKASGLAGFRLGALFACREMIAAMRRAATPYPVTTAALVAAVAAVRDTKFNRGYAREVLASRKILEAGLEKFGARIYPSEANFVLADFGPRAPKLVKALERQGILIRPRRDFPREGFVRISAGTRADTRRLLAALERLQ
jgi:histidinol-phosphate aminotransferase